MSSHPAFSILAYCCSSILMTVTNKYVLSGHEGFNLNFFLLLVQSIVCVLTIQTGKTLGIMTFRDFNKDEARKWLPISFLLVAMIYTGTKAIALMSIPVYTIFKNLTTILIAYGETLWFGGVVTPTMFFSFALMVLSSVVAAWPDISHALLAGKEGNTAGGQKSLANNAAYFWSILNCFCTAAYLLGMRKRIKLTNFKDYDTMFYNNLLTVPMLLVASLVLEDWSTSNVVKNFPDEHRALILFTMVLSGLSAIFISYTSAWCVRVTSSTTYSMVGALNKIPIAISGFVFFGDPVTVLKVSAVFLGFVSGLIYSFSKIAWSSKPPKDILPTTTEPSSKTA